MEESQEEPTQIDPQVVEQAKREEDLEQQRREHNARTGGAEVQKDELKIQRETHNARTAGETQSE